MDIIQQVNLGEWSLMNTVQAVSVQLYSVRIRRCIYKIHAPIN
jgi:hypothetical protein